LPPKLTGEHFPHVQRDHLILRDYLAASIAARRPGVNILIHGEPGSGKTEFVRMLANELGGALYEVASATREGRLLETENRFRAYRLSQALFARSSEKLILFDEIEDVFRDSDKGENTGSNDSSRKAWVNKLLEGNPVPAFWISNNIHVIDRAYLRRFDYLLEMKSPPRKVRSRILEQYLGDLPVSDSWKSRMAEHEDLMPAVVERAAKVVRSAHDLLPEETERSLARVIGNTLEVMGLSRDPRNPALSAGYRLDVLNTDCDMAEIQHSLASHREGRICLYGPPGTGKTAYGRHVASELDRPLLVRRASDIISPWLGMTERNLARMFRQAQEEEAVLLLDEADSFLQDRQNAQRSWELTEVNEMLTQMESFEGIFIASTNLMESLDSAALRRFDLKIRFDYLKPEQAWALFVDTRMHLGIDDGMDLESVIARLTCLTPGDFANVVRQARLRPVASSMALLHRLTGECEMKPEGRRKMIGFAA
jgi:transitional endoplasmic reticulum ATPase